MTIKKTELKKLQDFQETMFLEDYVIELEEVDANGDEYAIVCDIEVIETITETKVYEEDPRDNFEYSYKAEVTNFKIQDCYCNEIVISEIKQNELIETILDYIIN